MAPSVLEAQTARTEVVDLRFEGNENIPDSELRSVIRTRETECRTLLLAPFCAVTDWGFAHRRAWLDTLEVSADALRLRTYYQMKGYEDAAIDRNVQSNGVEARVEFTINEGPVTIIEELEILGLPESLNPTVASEVVGIRQGDPFDQVRLQTGKDSLEQVLQDLGYGRAIVLEETVRESQGPAQVVLDAFTGPRLRVGEIRISGAGDLGDDIVERLLPFESGSLFTRGGADEAQELLVELDAIRFASISPVSAQGEGAAGAAPDSTVDVLVQVTPANNRSALGGFGWSTDACLQAETVLTHRNLFGGARRLELTGRLKNILAQQIGGGFPCSDVGTTEAFRTLNYLVQAELSVPGLFGGANTLTSRLFLERETVPDVFIREGAGATFSLSRRLARQASATLTYAPELTGFDERSADIFFCVNFGFCAPADIETVTQSKRLAPVSMSLVLNRTDDPLQPRTGFYLAMEAEAAGRATGSQYEYVRGALQAAAFAELSRDLVFGVRARAGAVEALGEDDLIHPGKRFFAGGSQSVRGFGQNLLGPRVLVADEVTDCPGESFPSCVERLNRTAPGEFEQRPNGGNASLEMSLELRHRFSAQWGMVAFVDGGNVWDSLSELNEPVWTPGVGLRFIGPIGPVRVDLGYDPSSPVRLPVIASLSDGALVELDDMVVFNPFGFDQPSPALEFWRRLQVHVSIGEAF